MKPVAWITKDGVRCNPLHTFAGPTTVAWEVPLYSADQLRQAKVKVLREAADSMYPLGGSKWMHDRLRRMANEIEKGERKC